MKIKPTFRQRIERTQNGKYSETELVERIKDECAKFVHHICNDVAPNKDIMDLEQVVNAHLGYPFALELMHYSAWTDKVFSDLDKIMKDQFGDEYKSKTETTKTYHYPCENPDEKYPCSKCIRLVEDYGGTMVCEIGKDPKS